MLPQWGQDSEKESMSMSKMCVLFYFWSFIVTKPDKIDLIFQLILVNCVPTLLKHFFWPWKIFWSPVQHPRFSPIEQFLAIFGWRLEPSCDHTFRDGLDLTCSYSCWMGRLSESNRSADGGKPAPDELDLCGARGGIGYSSSWICQTPRNHCKSQIPHLCPLLPYMDCLRNRLIGAFILGGRKSLHLGRSEHH